MPSEDLEPLGCVCRYTLSPTLDPDLDYSKGAVPEDTGLLDILDGPWSVELFETTIPKPLHFTYVGLVHGLVMAPQYTPLF